MSWLPRQTSGEAQRKLATDDFVESYVRWREACEDVWRAVERWGNSPARQRSRAFEGYRAALEREEHAARIYRSCSELAAGSRP